MYTHFKRCYGHKCLDADGNHFEHLLYLQKSNVYSSFVIGILSITILIRFFPFLKCVYIFWHPLGTHTHTQNYNFAYCFVRV